MIDRQYMDWMAIWWELSTPESKIDGLGYMFDETGSYVTALYIITIVICIAIPISLLLRMPHQMKD